MRFPTETVEEEVGKLWAASKVVELGLNVTEPAVDKDILVDEVAVEEIRSEVVTLKSPPV
jgi:hypothetical protein